MSFTRMQSEKVEPSIEDRNIGTNIIANNSRCIDYSYMNEHFDFGIIYIGTEPGLKYRDAAIAATRVLDSSGVVIGGFTYRKKKKRFIMTRKGDIEKICFDGYSTLKLVKTTLPFERNFQFIQPLVLGNALPALMTDKIVQERKCFNNGDSYLRAIDATTLEIDEQQVNTCKTVEVKVESDWSLSNGSTPAWQVLSSKGVNFTDLNSVREYKPRNRKMARHKKKMLSREVFSVHKTGLMIPYADNSKEFVSGDYVRGNLEENRRIHVDAYTLSHDKSETGAVGQDPSETRGGMAFTFKEDLCSTYDGKFDIKLKSLNFDVHYMGKAIGSKRKKERQAILAALSNFNIRIINLAEDKGGGKREIEPGHIDQLHRLTQFKSKTVDDITDGKNNGGKKVDGGLRFLIEDTQGPNNKPELVLLTTNKAESYNKTRADPYITFKNSHDGVSQNFEFFNLFKHHQKKNDIGEIIETPILAEQKYKKKEDSYSDSTPVLDNILAQLLIKAEVYYGQTLVDRKCGQLPEGYTIVYPHRIEIIDDNDSDASDDEDSNLYETQFSGYDYCCARISGDQIKFGIMDEERLKRVDQFLGNSRVFVFGKPYRTEEGKTKYGHERHPLMIDEETGKYMIFVATKAHAMPKHYALEKIRHGLKADAVLRVPREWVESYVLNEIHPKKDREVTEKLLSMKDESDSQLNSFCFDDFRNSRKSLSTSDRAYIYSVIADEIDIFWHSNIKSSEGNPLVYHQDGFSFSTDSNRYFAGRVGSFKAGAQAGFCKIYEVINVGGVPENAHEWFITTIVRSGQTTVYPWIVQHVKEYARMARFMNNQNPDDTTIEDKPISVPVAADSTEDDIDREMRELEL